MDREYRRARMPEKCRSIYDKSIKSKAFAIKSFCLECTGYNRTEVKNCTDVGCSLWHHRPYREKKSGEPDEADDDGVGDVGGPGDVNDADPVDTEDKE